MSTPNQAPEFEHLLRVEDLGRQGMKALVERAAALADGAAPRDCQRAVVGLAFFQPSTRTRFGFATAAARLGAVPVDLFGARFAEGMSAPESLADTIRVVSGMADVLVLRHPSDTAVGEVRRSACCPVVSGGLGDDQHPTQALIDLLAMQRQLGRVRGLRIGLVGDLATSRACHSLLAALRWFEPLEVRLMAPEGRLPPKASLLGLPSRAVAGVGLAGLDVVYVAGLPEGVGASRLDAAAREPWRLTPSRVEALAAHARILCPLPRVDEIDVALDDDPRAGWFQQSDEGVFARMAVLERVLER
jgi:aspartate carbamoyltransferase catalytic subunit